MNTQRTTLYFYQREQFKLVLQGTHSRTLINGPSHSLAERLGTATVDETRLLTTDKHGSLLRKQAGQTTNSYVYTAYGHDVMQGGEPPYVGFNGERRDRYTGSYLLGQGYRAFSPALMRFHSPDSFSPFDEGGINAYAYCSGDPVNATDPTGHITVTQLRAVKLRPVKKSSVNSPAAKPSAPAGARRTVRFALKKNAVIPLRSTSEVSPNGSLTQHKPAENPALELNANNPRNSRSLFNDRRDYYSRATSEYNKLDKTSRQSALAYEYLTNEAIQLSGGIERIRRKAYETLDRQLQDAHNHFRKQVNALRRPG